MNRPGLVFFLLLLAVSMGSACTRESGLTGRYTAVLDSARQTRSVIELKKDGQGIWETEIDLVNFRWKVRGEEIWLHTKTGGVITGRLTSTGFVVEIPGVGQYEFIQENLHQKQ
ncbi:MAG: hypothetical protein ACOCPN_00685 [Desulfonatronovibrionaceae bacterium]